MFDHTKTYAVFAQGCSRGQLSFVDGSWRHYRQGEVNYFPANITKHELVGNIADILKEYDTNVHFIEEEN